MIKIHTVKYFFLVFLLLSYIFGFFLRENIAGGAEADFLKFTWPLIQSFKNDFFYTIKNYGSFGEGNLPLFHILNAYLNPLTFNEFYFQGSITIISVINVIIFAQIIKKKYKFKKIDAYLYSSIFLILPFFRSSAFWGITENFGWLFLLLSIKYFNCYEEEKKKDKIYYIFLICLFSSLALYTRSYLIFFPLFIILKSLFYRDFYLLKHSILFYILFSIPGIQLIFLWDGIFMLGDNNDINLIKDFHNPKFILKNLPIFFSIFTFYLIPFEFLNKISYTKKNFFIFFCILATLLFLDFLNVFDYLINLNVGGGVFLKLNNIILDNNLFFFFLSSSVGLLIILKYFNFSKKNKILIFCLLIFCFPRYILQEYFEPLVIIIFFTLLDLNKFSYKTLHKSKTIFVYSIYYICYFLGSFVYRYFIFN